MPKFVVELWLDGYENEEEMVEACKEFIENELDFSASGVKVEQIGDSVIKDATTVADYFRPLNNTPDYASAAQAAERLEKLLK